MLHFLVCEQSGNCDVRRLGKLRDAVHGLAADIDGAATNAVLVVSKSAFERDIQLGMFAVLAGAHHAADGRQGDNRSRF